MPQVCPDLGESILQRTDRLICRISREADLLPFLKRPGGNSVEVAVSNPTSKARKGRQIKKVCLSVDFNVFLTFKLEAVGG